MIRHCFPFKICISVCLCLFFQVILFFNKFFSFCLVFFHLGIKGDQNSFFMFGSCFHKIMSMHFFACRIYSCLPFAKCFLIFFCVTIIHHYCHVLASFWFFSCRCCGLW